MNQAKICIVGAGIAGVATAYWLSARFEAGSVVLIDPNQPLSFTTAASGENFRRYWPQLPLRALAGRSIDLMEEIAGEHGNPFKLRFSGYEFVSEGPNPGDSPFGADKEAMGEDLEGISDVAAIRESRPYLGPGIKQVMRLKRAGAVDVNALGSWMLAQARSAGARFLKGEVDLLQRRRGGGFEVGMRNGPDIHSLHADRVVLAAGPFCRDLARLLETDLPIENFPQRKIVLPDPLGVVPRNMPFTILADRQRLEWSREERDLLADDPEFAWMLDEFPAGLHIKPESANQIKLGWAFNRRPEEPAWNLPDDDGFAEIVMRGASRFIPGLRPYVESMPTPVIQFAGYYSRTPENLPLIGPLGVDGAFTVSALSGFGTMVACAAGELCAKWVKDAVLPEYARALHPSRYQDAGAMGEIDLVGPDGQL